MKRYVPSDVNNGAMWLLPRAIVFAAATTIVLLAQLSLPDKASWEANATLLYGCVGLLAVQEILRFTGSGRHADRVRTYEADMKAVLGAGLTAVARDLNVPFDQIGVHAFLARGRGRFRTLANVGGLRLGSRPSLVRSSWRPGKGLAGKAWDTQEQAAADWQRIAGVARTGGRVAWESLPPEQSYRLSWAEIQLTREYRGVVAAPVFDADNRLIGCVTIDAPLPVSRLNGDTMAGILADVARGVAGTGYPPASWWTRTR